MRKKVLFILMFTFMIAITSCMGIVKYSAPSIIQVNDFITKNSINTLAMLILNDGTHRYTALQQLGVAEYYAIIWATKKQDYEEFIKQYNKAAD